MDINEFIKKRRISLKLSLEDVAKQCNVSKSTVLRWENGDIFNMKRDKIDSLAKALKIKPSVLIDNSITPELEDLTIVFDDYFPLHYSTNLSAGTLDELLNSEPDAVVYVPIKYQSMKKRLHAFKINGTSMNNVIEDGSIVIVEDIPYLKIKDGTIVVALVNGLATVKRFYLKDNSVTLMPDSSDKSHLPIIINTEDEQVFIVGRVIWHMNPDDIEKYY